MMWQYTRREMKVLLLATLLVFSGFGLVLGQGWRDAGVNLSPEEQAANSVGVLAAVPDNEVNSIATQLRQREAEISAREEAFAQTQGRADTRTLALVSVIGAGLLGLILMNFYLDMRRRHSLA